MPWLRTDDVEYDDVLVRAVGNAAYGAVQRMKLYCSAQRTDGWIPADKAREIASRAELRALTEMRVADRGPFLHQHGDECRCLEGRDWPAELGGFYVHGFLDRNPSRSENDVHKAKRRELRDPQLKAAVRARDGSRCRYCGIEVRWQDRKTPAGGVFDHVDPKIAAGADNLVVACRGCNSRKQDCTPEVAGMDLLPPPDPDKINDGPTSDQRKINATSAPGPRSAVGSDPDPARTPDPPDGTDTPAPTYTNGQVAPGNGQIRDGISGGTTVGLGRGGAGMGAALKPSWKDRVGDAGPTGKRPTVGPPTTARGNLAPSPYAKGITGYTPPAPDDVDEDQAELCVHGYPVDTGCVECEQSLPGSDGPP
ncbi:HNH endonuclease [Amycolatopsis methanolica]|uniref:HNH nuclease domain-containing protein n=1 Tax=Amycolatopsis methanolica 239 TaxID=1068978 RepID=A0A076N6B4_AMYME|nr:HNH endonuclease [Amycolatopsis methanolica]AIJ26380.1 hypothetical protein AMETH_6288 [Amycolatopsis methanolica 239]AIJ26439.1 hypothetical protein AMETH_6347 [Amycolatopsis methanolica 239]